MLKQFPVLVFLSTILAVAQNPATTTPPLPPGPVTKAAPEANQDFSQQPAVIEQFRIRYRWEADGTGTRQMILRAKLQSPLGVQQFGQIPLGYSSANESVKINYVRVRKTDGRVVDVPSGNIQDLTAPIAREAPMYSDFRVKQIVVPSLEVGDTLEYDVVVQITKALADHEFWLEHDFNRNTIMLDEQLDVDVPAAVKVTLKTNAGFEPKVEIAQGRRLYSWKRQNLTIEDDTDDTSEKKKHKRRDLTDPDHHPDVQMTTFQSWQELGDWFAGLVKDRVLATDQVRTKALELARGKTTDAEKVEALYNFVSKQYRYVSLSFGIGRFQPHAASDVFVNQYGDCKDKHTLLASMLAAVNIQSDPVLIHSWRHLDEAVPSPGQFDHVISAVNIGGKRMLLDVTPETAPFGLLSPTLRHKKAVLVRASKGSKIIDTPSSVPFDTKEVVALTGKVNDLGKLEASMHIELRGDSEMYIRNAFRQVPPARWNVVAKAFQAALGINGEATDIKTSPIEDTSKPFSVDWKLTAVNYLDWTNKDFDLRLPVAPTKLPSFDEEAESADQKPLEVPGVPLNATYSVNLQLPARYSLTLPVAINLTRDYGEYHTKYTQEKDKVIAEKQFKFTVYELPYDRRSDYLAFSRSIAADEKQRLHLESASAGNSAIPAGMKAEDLDQAGSSALQNDNPREAAVLFERLVELEPKHQTAWNNLGRSYLGLHELEKAEKAFRKEIQINPYDEYAYNNLGFTLQREERFDDALAAYRKQIEINPLDRFAHSALGNLLLTRKRYAEAATELQTAAGINPKSGYLQSQLGTAYLNLNQGDKAASAYDKAIELAPSPLVWNDIAYELSQKGVQLDRARSYAESAVSTSAASLRNISLEHLQLADLANTSSISAFWDTLGWVRFKQGDSASALEYIGAAWSLSQHADVADHLGQIQEKLGHLPEARHFYTLSAAGSQPTPDVREHAVKAIGSEKALAAILPSAKAEITQSRTHRVKNAGSITGKADFFILFNLDGKPEDAKFVDGDEALKPLAPQITQSPLSFRMPNGSKVKLVRRGTLTCTHDERDCTFVLLLPDDSTRLD